MFETLEPSQRRVARGWPLLVYGFYGLVSLLFVIPDLRRHSFSRVFSLALAAVTFFLSLVWFVTALISKPPVTDRRLLSRSQILLLLLFAADTIPYILQ